MLLRAYEEAVVDLGREGGLKQEPKAKLKAYIFLSLSFFESGKLRQLRIGRKFEQSKEPTQVLSLASLGLRWGSSRRC